MAVEYTLKPSWQNEGKSMSLTWASLLVQSSKNLRRRSLGPILGASYFCPFGYSSMFDIGLQTLPVVHRFACSPCLCLYSTSLVVPSLGGDRIAQELVMYGGWGQGSDGAGLFYGCGAGWGAGCGAETCCTGDGVFVVARLGEDVWGWPC